MVALTDFQSHLGLGDRMSGSNAGMLVRNSSLVTNATGLFAAGGGVLLSYGNNSVNGNVTTDGALTGDSVVAVTGHHTVAHHFAKIPPPVPFAMMPK